MYRLLLVAAVASVAAFRAPTGMMRTSGAALRPTSSALRAEDFYGEPIQDAPKIEFDETALEGSNIGTRDDWKNGVYAGSVLLGVLLPVFFLVVQGNGV